MKTLIVEDDFVTRKVLMKTLMAAGPCDVAVSGTEAVEVINAAWNSAAPYDVICLDIMLPDISGIDVLHTLRHHEQLRGINGLEGVKVIMTTAVEDSSTVLSAFRSGCEAYLVKPFSRKDLLEAIKSLNLDGVLASGDEKAE